MPRPGSKKQYAFYADSDVARCLSNYTGNKTDLMNKLLREFFSLPNTERDYAAEIDALKARLDLLEPPKKKEPKCKTCCDRKIVPNWQDWDDYHGEPRPKPCPDCTSNSLA